MVIAFQGETGAYSEAAGAKFDPDATLPALSGLRGRLRGGRGRRGRPAASCRSRTRSAAPSTATTTSWSSTSCRSSARSSCRSVHQPAGAARARRSTDLQQVYSHPQALAQCDRFLRSLTGVEIVATYDTAGSAKMIARAAAWPASAAIASERAAAVFGLETLEVGHPGLRRQHHALPDRHPRRRPPRASPARAGQQDHHRLHAAEQAGRAVQGAERLRAARHRPHQARVAADSGRPWEYLFYVDLAVGRTSSRCDRALAHLAEFAPIAEAARLVPRRCARSAAAPVAQDARVAGGVA